MQDQVVYNECLVVLPVDEMNTRYNAEYFVQVYNRLVLPSLIESGYIPVWVRKDFLKENNYIEVLKKMINVPVVLFDISVRSGWAMNLLGMRYVYDKPVVFIQNKEVPKVFDFHKKKYIEYNLQSNLELEVARRKIVRILNSFHDQY